MQMTPAYRKFSSYNVQPKLFGKNTGTALAYDRVIKTTFVLGVILFQIQIVHAGRFSWPVLTSSLHPTALLGDYTCTMFEMCNDKQTVILIKTESS